MRPWVETCRVPLSRYKRKKDEKSNSPCNEIQLSVEDFVK